MSVVRFPTASNDVCKVCGTELAENVSYAWFDRYDGMCHRVCVEMERAADVLMRRILDTLENK